MDFLSTQTARNLARSFAGETQARGRYTAYAGQARREKQEYLARIFETTADNERAHAGEFLEMLNKHAGKPVENLEVSAGYPYALGNTGDNLQFAADGERTEHDDAYQSFAETARREGFDDAARLWTLIAVVEGQHREIFEDARRQLADGSLYQKDRPTVWRCLNCGYVAEALEPWETCPVCHKDRGWARGRVDEVRAPEKRSG